MALHLDLHHEITQQERERKRDPLKLGILFISVIALCCVVYLLINLNHVRKLRGELARARTEWAELEEKEKTAKVREAELLRERALADVLQGSIDSRFFWAPFLELMGQAVPENVQITRMSAGIAADKKLTVSLEGLAAGDQPRQVAESFRLNLENKFAERFTSADATFRSLEDGRTVVKLRGRDLDVVQFSITMEVDTSGSNVAQLPDRRLTTLAEDPQP